MVDTLRYMEKNRPPTRAVTNPLHQYALDSKTDRAQ